jgi:hypothetical protein
MDLPVHLSTFPDLLEELLEEPLVGQRDRILLDAVHRLGAAAAAGLWRPLSPDGGWYAVRERGPAELLPEPEATRAALGLSDREGEDASSVLCQGGRSRLLGGEAEGVALVLADVTEDEAALDLLRALLQVESDIVRDHPDACEPPSPYAA